VSHFAALAGGRWGAFDVVSRTRRAKPALAPALRYGVQHQPRGTSRDRSKESPMLNYAIVFFVVALIAAALGFGGFIAGTAMSIAKILFFGFLILTGISVVMNFTRKAV
jgi:uncharacterized membrane protein YtjA (UPF0391 family)